MHFGIDLPNYGAYSDPNRLVDLAQLAEEAGWDGIFLWDHLLRFDDPGIPMVDPWIALAAVAERTHRIRIGPMVTPLARRRPWKLAREIVTLDHLSRGRVILGVGLGARSVTEFQSFGDAGDPRTRAEMLDEGLEILVGLWSGEPFQFQGKHYQIDETLFLPRPLQSPRVPVWVAGTWPHKRPFQRASRWDGAFPLGAGQGYLEMMTPAEVSAVAAYVQEVRQEAASFDLIHLGFTGGEDVESDAAVIRAYDQAGVTWWLENLDLRRGSLNLLQARIRRGPPKFSPNPNLA